SARSRSNSCEIFSTRMKPVLSREILMEPTFTPMSQATQPKNQPTLADAFETIGQGTFLAALFRGLSDLDRTDLAQFSSKWPLFPEASRIRAIQVMDELAEEN